MQTVSQFYQYGTYVVMHRVEHLLEVVKLLRHVILLLVLLRYHPYQESDIIAKLLVDFLVGARGILHHIVEECGTYGRSTQLQFLSHNQRYGNGMDNIWLTRLSALLSVSLACKDECLLDKLHLLQRSAFLHGGEHLTCPEIYLFF